MKTQLGVMERALAQLFDYAGMFPPATLDLHAALRNYLDYGSSAHAWALGRLVIDARNLSALSEAAAQTMQDLRLSVLATPSDAASIEKCLAEGLPIEAIELKAEKSNRIQRWHEIHAAGIEVYVEVPLREMDSDLLNAIGQAGMHAKLRMGGVVAEAFPAVEPVAAALKMLAERRIAFKATAGLHHPLRSRRAFTYESDSPTGPMHGFVNLLCAASIVWFGGEAAEAAQLLDEQDPRAWQVMAGSICWRGRDWSTAQLRAVREHFMKGIGACSFTEPIRDLEELGWL